jgi:very-short-patch-repair endonuclease
MRYKLLEYYQNPFSRPTVEGVDLNKVRELAETLVRRIDNKPPPFGSWFEVDVCLDIAHRGFKIIPQYDVAGYFIDMVVEGEQGQLAVECDGDEWHGPEYYERDMARQRMLERCGWRFWRIRGHEYYRNPADALEPLWKLLSDMGIKPHISSLESAVVVESKEYGEEAGPKATMVSEEAKDIREYAVVEESKPQPVLDNIPAPELVERGAENIVVPSPPGKSEVYNYPPQFFFKLAHLAKEGKKLEPWERSLVFKIGTYLIRGWQISEKMERQAIRIMRMARQGGLVQAVEKELEKNQPPNPDSAN